MNGDGLVSSPTRGYIRYTPSSNRRVGVAYFMLERCLLRGQQLDLLVAALIC